MFATIGHQIFNRDYRHIVLLSELDALRRAGHGAIVIGQLAQHACWFKASQGHEVDSGFGVAAAGQYAARLRTQREDVTWTVKIGRFRAVGDGRADGGHAVGSGDAGGHTFGRFDGHGEASAVGAGVVEAFSWRWVFFASLPVALLTFVLAVRWLNDTPGPVRPTRFLPLSLLADPLLRFAMLIYLCVPGMFIGVNVVGMYYLQRVTGMAPGAIGALMVPWSLASFAAITFTGRYFNRFGPRPLVIIGCLLQAMGIMLLLKIDADSPLALLILAFTLMGGGGSLCSSTAQSSAFLHTPAEEMPDASAIWNLNRQLSFFAGSALLALLLRVFPPAYAWQGVFISAAVITLLPLLFCLRLNNRAIIHRLHTTLEKS